MKADRTLDCVGLYCPMPIVKTSQEIKEMQPGEVLEVIADDKGIKSDMPGAPGLGLQDRQRVPGDERRRRRDQGLREKRLTI